jgi:hypothetical protein
MSVFLLKNCTNFWVYVVVISQALILAVLAKMRCELAILGRSAGVHVLE